MDNPHPFNGATLPPTYLLPQQLANNLNNIRGAHDFTATPDTLKMELPWDSTRPNMADLQEKQHVRILKNDQS